MSRNLDLTALRSFVAVADAGGVTKAAGFLHLTQSAVSMQLKRLEESMNVSLLDRSSRQIALTAPGEQLLSYARRMLALNDEVYGKLTHQSYEGEFTLGVPHDIVYPGIPGVLQRFHREYPRMKVQLISSYTTKLKSLFAQGECDVILTTENSADKGAEILAERPLVWVGAPGGQAWKTRPLRLAFEHNCIFRQGAQGALDRAGIPWEMAVESESSRTIEASVNADLAVHAVIEGMQGPRMEEIDHGGALPELESTKINLYVTAVDRGPVCEAMSRLLRGAFNAL
ncbi:LysR family transcriptional regulator [Halocynthiibacter sp.]|uniref:LysR family transcriptional regulator n=1 Tax=Halocynthiibacter sp. TaxID=1979210 RepID=UPI003C6741BB